jgi:hypothetical protein
MTTSDLFSLELEFQSFPLFFSEPRQTMFACATLLAQWVKLSSVPMGGAHHAMEEVVMATCAR